MTVAGLEAGKVGDFMRLSRRNLIQFEQIARLKGRVSRNGRLKAGRKGPCLADLSYLCLIRHRWLLWRRRCRLPKSKRRKWRAGP